MVLVVVVVVSHSVMSNSLPPPWTAVHQASLSFTILWSLLKLMSTELMMPSNHLSPHCLPALNFSQHQGLFQAFALGTQSTRASASVLPMKGQGWFPLVLTGLISLLSKGFWRVVPSTTVWNHQFFSAQSSLRFNSHIHTWLLEKPWLWLYVPLSAKWCLCFLTCYLGLS